MQKIWEILRSNQIRFWCLKSLWVGLHKQPLRIANVDFPSKFAESTVLRFQHGLQSVSNQHFYSNLHNHLLVISQQTILLKYLSRFTYKLQLNFEDKYRVNFVYKSWNWRQSSLYVMTILSTIKIIMECNNFLFQLALAVNQSNKIYEVILYWLNLFHKFFLFKKKTTSAVNKFASLYLKHTLVWYFISERKNKKIYWNIYQFVDYQKVLISKSRNMNDLKILDKCSSMHQFEVSKCKRELLMWKLIEFF